MKTIILLGGLFSSFSSLPLEQSGFQWGYGYDNGPNVWGTHFPQCNGYRQSPIALPTNVANSSQLQRIEFHDYIHDYYNLSFVNDGDAIKFYLRGSERPSLSGSVFGNQMRYKLDQIILRFGSHNGAGSEHRMNGKDYPGEDQRIWFNGEFDSLEDALKVPGNVAITAHMFEISPEDTPYLAPAVNGVTQINGTDKSIDFVHKFAVEEDYRINNITIDSNGIERCVNCDYYFYEGSLSYPPCTEGVYWHIYMDPYPVSERQLKVLRSVVSPGDFKIMSDNFRNLQPVNFRDVLQYREKLDLIGH